MSGRFSKSEIDRLGERIRAAERLSAEDLGMLQAWRAERDPDLGIVREALFDLGFHPTARLKTHNTLVEKIRRQPGLRLSRVQDVAGCRLVVHGGRPEQDDAVDRIGARFPGCRIVDRRERPSHGYRAVHLIVDVRGWPVEVQVRTDLQHAWAEVFEEFADLFGRDLRYGGQPSIQWTGSRFSAGRLLVPLLRRQVQGLVPALQRLADTVDEAERIGAPPDELERVRRSLLTQHELALTVLERFGRRQ